MLQLPDLPTTIKTFYPSLHALNCYMWIELFYKTYELILIRIFAWLGRGMFLNECFPLPVSYFCVPPGPWLQMQINLFLWNIHFFRFCIQCAAHGLTAHHELSSVKYYSPLQHICHGFESVSTCTNLSKWWVHLVCPRAAGFRTTDDVLRAAINLCKVCEDKFFYNKLSPWIFCLYPDAYCRTSDVSLPSAAVAEHVVELNSSETCTERVICLKECRCVFLSSSANIRSFHAAPGCSCSLCVCSRVRENQFLHINMRIEEEDATGCFQSCNTSASGKPSQSTVFVLSALTVIALQARGVLNAVQRILVFCARWSMRSSCQPRAAHC